MVLASVFIVLCVIYIIAFERFGPGRLAGSPASTGVLPFQVLFRDLPAGEQRMFREMQEGVVEMLATGPSRGDWPSVAALEKQGIPPFAPDVLDKADTQWTLQRDRLLYEYVGIPSADVSAPAFMIMILEPDPQNGEKADPSLVDEEHQLMPDGRLLHVTYWEHAPPHPSPEVALDPSKSGWMQIRVKTLFEEMKS